MTPKGREVLEQLRIEEGLDPRLPWGGRSPRSLTQAALARKLSQRDDDVDREADEMLEEMCRRHQYGW